jgi:hypothetical protein
MRVCENGVRSCLVRTVDRKSGSLRGIEIYGSITAHKKARR